MRDIIARIKCRTQMCPQSIQITLRGGINQVAWTCLDCGTVNEYVQLVTIT